MRAVNWLATSWLNPRRILLACVLLACVPFAVPFASFTSADVVDAPKPAIIAAAEQPATYDLEPKPIQFLEAGTRIADGPPDGWSHLIIKTDVAVANSEVLGAGVADAICQFFTALTAHAERSADSRWRLSKIAMGTGMRTEAGAIIVSKDPSAKVGKRLSFLANKVLRQHEAHVAMVVVRARSKTLAIVDDPTWMNQNGKHAPVVIRYAMLLDSANGQLQTFVWGVNGAEQTCCAGPMECLTPNCVHQCCLNVDHRQCLLGVPMKESALALSQLPQGKSRIEMPATMRQHAGRIRFTADQVAALESALRAVCTK